MSSEDKIDTAKFLKRLENIRKVWAASSEPWAKADALCVVYGANVDDLYYSKTISMFLYLFGFEFTDSIVLITQTEFFFMSSEKKCKMLQDALVGVEGKFNLILRTKDEGATRESFHTMINAVRKNGGSRIGYDVKGAYQGNFAESWFALVESSQLEIIDIAPGISSILLVKDINELDSCKKAAIISNKILKHGFFEKCQEYIDEDKEITHATFATELEKIFTDPSSINLTNVPRQHLDSCFSPIIQSGGQYSMKVNATSDESPLTADVVICSLGARYKGYCSYISRTFIFDGPERIQTVYKILVELYNTCLRAMVVNVPFSSVSKAARTFLTENHPDLVPYMPKIFGFSMGLEFRDKYSLLTENNNLMFAADMVFNLSVSFDAVPLPEEERKGRYANMEKFSVVIADTVRIQTDSYAEPYTKANFEEIFYALDENAEGDGEEDGEDDGEGGEEEEDGEPEGPARRSGRHKEVATNQEKSFSRAQTQREIMEKRIQQGLKNRKGFGIDLNSKVEELGEARNLKTFNSASEYPSEVAPHMPYLDSRHECLFLPMQGQPVPFHISMVKALVPTLGDHSLASTLRISFYVPGMSLGKEVSRNTKALIQKYNEQTPFIKEVHFRSMNKRHVEKLANDFKELQKRVRQREALAEQERNLVVQDKLQKIRDQRAPRLQDVTMRPTISGKKSTGTLEAHQNGLRFSSVKGETQDILYANIKHCVFQKCKMSTMVLVHFHLKENVMVGKKKLKDIQFFQEVLESSTNLDSVRRSYSEVEEIEEEERERKLRKKLNSLFGEFCSKLERLTTHFNIPIKIEVPIWEVGFMASVGHNNVFIQPTANCLVNVTDQPPFIVSLNEMDHCHFERVSFSSRNFDMTFIPKDLSAPRQLQMIEMKNKDKIQDWLNMINMTYTESKIPINWTAIINFVKSDLDHFFSDVSSKGEPKKPGWLFLSEDDDEENGDEEGSGSEYSEPDSESESDDDDDESFGDDEDEEDEDGEEYEDEEDEEEEEEEDDEPPPPKRKGSEPSGSNKRSKH